MLETLLLPFFALFMGSLYEGAEQGYPKVGFGPEIAPRKSRTGNGKICLFILAFVLVCFCGLRTRMNDTGNYLHGFFRIESDFITGFQHINWVIGANPAFQLFQLLIRCFISSDGQVFIFLTSFITVTSYVFFLRSYSTDMSLAMFAFVTFCGYSFVTAAIKQSLATAIAIWAIPSILENKSVKAFFLFAIALLVHPYSILLASAFIFKKDIWDRKTYILLFASVISGFFFVQIMNLLVSATDMIGEDFDVLTLTESNGISILRAGEALVIPVFTFVNRNALKRQNNQLINVAVNFSVLSACFSILSLSGGAVLIGRIPNYFSIFNCLAFVYLARVGLKDKDNSNLINLIICISFFVFDYYGARKYLYGYCGGDWTKSFYNRVSFFTMLQGWFKF